jgi:glycosyltransferase involved in cell wall biosynthesis
MDLDTFYPRHAQQSLPAQLRILAMARPGTPYRGFTTLIAACQRILAARPEVHIHLFGDRSLRRHPIPFPFHDEGLVADQQQLAALYSAADLFIDASDFQGFGRCALEAMACGTACVLTNAGGVREYAVHEQNALLVAPRDPHALADAAVALLDQPHERQRLAAAGLTTARDYDLQREADQTLALFSRLAKASQAPDASCG